MKTLYIERDLQTGNITSQSLLTQEPTGEKYGQPVFLNEGEYDIYVNGTLEEVKELVENQIQKARWGSMSQKWAKQSDA